jgi:hypothetical protein
MKYQTIRDHRTMIDYPPLDHHHRVITRMLKTRVPGFGDDPHDVVAVERAAEYNAMDVSVTFRGMVFRDRIEKPFDPFREDWQDVFPSKDTVNRMLLLA